MIDFDTEIRVYKAKYNESDQFFLDLLGISRKTFWGKRKGIAPFTAYEVFELADALGIDPRELYESMPKATNDPRHAVAKPS